MEQQEMTMTVATEEKGGGTLLRRMVLVLAVAALMAVMMALSAMPAFAAASPNANQVGKQTSGVNTTDPTPGRGGKATSEAARDNGGLDFVARYEHHLPNN